MSLFGFFGPPNVEKLEAKRDVQGLIKTLGYKKDRNVRWKAVQALGEIGDARAVEPLRAALNDEDPAVREAAAEALRQIEDIQGVEKKDVELSKQTALTLPQPQGDVPTQQPVSIPSARIDQATVAFTLRDKALLTQGGAVMSVAISLDGTLIVSASQDRVVRVWDRSQSSLVAETKVSLSPWCVSISPDKQAILVGGFRDDRPDSGPVDMLDLASGKAKSRFNMHVRPVLSIAFSPDGKLVASTGRDWMVKVWELATGKLLLAGQHQDAGVMVVFTPDTYRVVSLSHDWALKVWDPKSKSCIAMWAGEPDLYQAVLSADGRWASVGNKERGGSIIDVATGKTTASWKTEAKIRALYASSNGSLVVWEAKGNVLKGWHVQSQKYVSVLEGHAGDINCVAVSADGTCVVTGGEDGALGIWEVTYENYVGEAAAALRQIEERQGVEPLKVALEDRGSASENVIEIAGSYGIDEAAPLPIKSGKTMSDQLKCPHCGEELTGMARIMLETAMSEKEMVDFQTNCSSCGRIIRKQDIMVVPKSLRGVSEKFIGQLHSSWLPKTFTVSPNNRRVAYVAGVGGKVFVVVDGNEGEHYDGTGSGSLTFGPDSQRVAYWAVMGNKQFVVVDGNEGKHYDSIGAGTLIFSPDSQRAAYAARVGDKWFVIVDGNEGKHYDGVGAGTLIFSPNSERIAYTAQAGDKWFTVVDGNEGKHYDGIGSLTFSPDSWRVAYLAKVGDKWFVVADGEEGKHYDGIGALTFSPDSQRMAYVAKVGDKVFVVVDGKEEGPYDGFGSGGLIFSPDNQRVAYAAVEGDEVFVIVNGEEGKQYDGIGALTFSPNSERMAYVAGVGDKWFVVVDGKEEGPYDGFGAGTLIFSPNSERIAYTAQVGGKWFTVVDGNEGKRYDEGRSLIFSPDSRRVAYLAITGDKMFVVVDGEEGNPYDVITFVGQRIVFDSPDSFHYLARKDRDIYLVEEMLKS
jgi:WD40 repeat protein